MRAVFGLLLVLLGVVTGYLVLEGKLPPTSVDTSSTTSGTNITDNQINSRYRNQNGSTDQNQQLTSQQLNYLRQQGSMNSGGNIPVQGSNLNPMGLPTMQYLQDIGASQGGLH